ncbi:hypothetical protein HDU87_007316 [Geranomyces variabilis]|uniref:Uncharacterized protein n=1 Tax=Geranomyces variabilis TaxID=109894 RepID=A0AAD5TE54_9FUNG|nr:hypothetical protein HDU87_007316 [Geranomyces variabilis]
MKSGADHATALLRAPRNEFRPDAWSKELHKLAVNAITDVKSARAPSLEAAVAGAQTCWQVLVNLDLLNLADHGECYLEIAIQHQTNDCIEHLLRKGVRSDTALLTILDRDPPDMVLFERLFNNPSFYTERSWSITVEGLTRPPLEAANRSEAVALLISRPLLGAPTAELVMGLAFLSKAHNGHPACSLLPQVVAGSGKEEIRRLAIQSWSSAIQCWKDHGDNSMSDFMRQLDGTLFLQESYGIDAFEEELFLSLATCGGRMRSRGGECSAEDVEAVHRGMFHDIDEHGHSAFAERLLLGMRDRFTPIQLSDDDDDDDDDRSYYDRSGDDRYMRHCFLKLLKTYPIRIKDRQNFLLALVSIEQTQRLENEPDFLYDLFWKEGIAVSTSEAYAHDILFMSPLGKFEVPLSPQLLVSACVASGQSFLWILLHSGVKLPDSNYSGTLDEMTATIQKAASRGLAWIAGAFELVAEPLCVDTSLLNAHISEFVGHCLMTYRLRIGRYFNNLNPHVSRNYSRPSLQPLADVAARCGWHEVAEYCLELDRSALPPPY